MQEVRGALSVDLAEEVRALPKTMRQKLLSEASLPLEIPADHALAMKANLSISWNKLRSLRRSANCSTQTHVHSNYTINLYM